MVAIHSTLTVNSHTLLNSSIPQTKLTSDFNVTSLPTLVILDLQSLAVITWDGVGVVMSSEPDWNWTVGNNELTNSQDREMEGRLDLHDALKNLKSNRHNVSFSLPESPDQTPDTNSQTPEFLHQIQTNDSSETQLQHAGGRMFQTADRQTRTQTRSFNNKTNVQQTPVIRSESESPDKGATLTPVHSSPALIQDFVDSNVQRKVSLRSRESEDPQHQLVKPVARHPETFRGNRCVPLTNTPGSAFSSVRHRATRRQHPPQDQPQPQADHEVPQEDTPENLHTKLQLQLHTGSLYTTRVPHSSSTPTRYSLDKHTNTGGWEEGEEVPPVCRKHVWSDGQLDSCSGQVQRFADSATSQTSEVVNTVSCQTRMSDLKHGGGGESREKTVTCHVVNTAQKQRRRGRRYRSGLGGGDDSDERESSEEYESWRLGEAGDRNGERRGDGPTTDRGGQTDECRRTGRVSGSAGKSKHRSDVTLGDPGDVRVPSVDDDRHDTNALRLRGHFSPVRQNKVASHVRRNDVISPDSEVRSLTSEAASDVTRRPAVAVISLSRPKVKVNKKGYSPQRSRSFYQTKPASVRSSSAHHFLGD